MMKTLRAWLACAMLVVPAVAMAQAAAGPLKSDQVRIQYAVFYLPAPAADPLQRLNALATANRAGPMLTDTLPVGATRLALVRGRVEKDPRAKYRPPDLALLQHLGRGLSPEQGRALQQTQQVLVLDFAHPGARALESLRAADELVEKLAREAGALVWDQQTREIFTPDAWKQRRLDTWSGNLPQVGRHITFYAYNKGQMVRAVSLGMAKFGLPDVVVQDFSRSASRPMGILLGALTQSLVEGAPASLPGNFKLELASIRHPQVQKELAAASKKGATGIAQLTLSPGTPEKEDPPGRLLEVGFPAEPGADRHAAYAALLRSAFGGEDTVMTVKPNAPELLEASKRARERLPQLKAAFAAGLAPGEFIQLRMPFRTPQGGIEYMWVEVTDWKDSRITGILKNQPRAIPTLREGQVVEVREENAFDYLRISADGKREGNETGKVAQKLGGR
ncbi:MAG: DUF2314 domain-containing protein [Burkholderiales bacterium]|nr:DUF2314 domain-containing protein [Burkholderiales bacterium]